MSSPSPSLRSAPEEYELEVPKFQKSMLNDTAKIAEGPEGHYKHYFKVRELRKDSRGLASKTYVAIGYIGTAVTIGSAVLTEGISLAGGLLITRGLGLGYATDWAQRKVHAYYTGKTRNPVGGDRVAEALVLLDTIRKASNAALFIERITEAYSPSYFTSSHSSWNLIEKLKGDAGLDEKFEQLATYIGRVPEKPELQSVYYNNGKRLFDVILSLVEHTTIRVIHVWDTMGPALLE